MTQTKDSQKECQFCEIEEIKEMFNEKFLPKILEISQRVKKESSEEIRFFNVLMWLQFDAFEEILRIEDILERMSLQLQPITQADLDRTREQNNGNSQKNF